VTWASRNEILNPANMVDWRDFDPKNVRVGPLMTNHQMNGQASHRLHLRYVDPDDASATERPLLLSSTRALAGLISDGLEKNQGFATFDGGSVAPSLHMNFKLVASPQNIVSQRKIIEGLQMLVTHLELYLEVSGLMPEIIRLVGEVDARAAARYANPEEPLISPIFRSVTNTSQIQGANSDTEAEEIAFLPMKVMSMPSSDDPTRLVSSVPFFRINQEGRQTQAEPIDPDLVAKPWSCEPVINISDLVIIPRPNGKTFVGLTLRLVQCQIRSYTGPNPNIKTEAQRSIQTSLLVGLQRE
jgi:hypothetical protein